MGLELVIDTDTGEIQKVTFADFRLLYPRRVAMKDAERAWMRLTEGDKISALVALVDWRRVWQDKDTQFIPYPATWIRGERWTDELPNEFTQTSAAHKPAVLAKTERGEMPAHVRELLAKMRGQR